MFIAIQSIIGVMHIYPFLAVSYTTGSECVDIYIHHVHLHMSTYHHHLPVKLRHLTRNLGILSRSIYGKLGYLSLDI